MDHRPTVAGSALCESTVVHCDQAIFTSIRSPTGQGYRLIAASPGLRADEKAEITQRSPSHDSLCDPSPSAFGLAVYRLRSGRHCVAYSRYAGAEHTARGGQRVHTHIAVLDREAYRRFECNPARAHASLAEAVGDSPILNPPARLDPLPLETHLPRFLARDTLVFARVRDGDQLAYVLASLLAGHRLIVTGSTGPLATLERVLTGLPMNLREPVAASVGLRFSPSRQMQLTFTNANPAELQRVIKGHCVQCFDMQSPPPQAVPPDGWIGLVRRWWNEGRVRDVSRLTAELPGPLHPGDLNRIAAICADMDRIRHAQSADLEVLRARYEQFRPRNEAEVGLVRQLLAGVTTRSESLEADGGVMPPRA